MVDLSANPFNPIAPSELILRENGAIYHLNLLPEHIPSKIIVVGDPNRVAMVSNRFESIEVKVSGREFHTHVGSFNGERLAVLSTGIGVDNIDIVLNELDALVNIDFSTRTIKHQKKSLEIIRLGTSGSLQKDLPVDAFLLSEFALGLDGLMNFYARDLNTMEKKLARDFEHQIDYPEILPKPYFVQGDPTLFRLFKGDAEQGITATASGFYGPQGRMLRLKTNFKNQNEHLARFRSEDHRITNFEMETSALYGLSQLLGHKAITICAIIANRLKGEFSQDPARTIQRLIDLVLQRLTT
jgi:uridine phosphorylase